MVVMKFLSGIQSTNLSANCKQKLEMILEKQSLAVDSFYNVGTGKRTSLKELAEKLLVLTGCPNPIQFAPRSQATLVRNRVGSAKKASAEIGFTSQIDLNEGLQRLIDWRASHKAEVAARRNAVGLPS